MLHRLCLTTVLFIALSSIVHAAGLPMMNEITPANKANIILAQLIAKSIEQDPFGEAVIEGSKCTTPNHFLEAIKSYHPEALLENVAELPVYIRSLQSRPVPPVEFQMSRILYSRNGDVDKCVLDINGWTRTVDNPELAWFDSNLGKPVLAGNCSNVIGDTVVDKKLTPRTSSSAGPYILRVRFWNWEKFSPDMHARIRKINKNEENSTYRKKEGAVSRNLGDDFMKLWKRGKASTIAVSIKAWVYYPTRLNQVITARPGDNPKHPDLVYWEVTVPRNVVDKEEAQFGVIPLAPAGCTVVYPRAGAWLSTRRGELSESSRNGSSGMSLNAIVSCP